MNFDDFDIGWEELATAAALAEEIAEDELERLLLERDLPQDEYQDVDD